METATQPDDASSNPGVIPRKFITRKTVGPKVEMSEDW